MALITVVWLYYALYRFRDPGAGLGLSEFLITRGAGGKILGSRYAGYNGIYFEKLCPLFFPSVLAFYISATRRQYEILWITAILLMLAASLLTFGRTGWVGIFLALQPFIWKYSRGRWLGLSLVTGLAVVILFKPGLASFLFSRFKPLLSWEEFQTIPQYGIWQGAWQMFLDHPFTGVGLAMFKNYAADYGLEFYIFTRSFLGERIKEFHVWVEAHSTFFHIISEQGILGLIAWIAILWIPLRSLFRKQKENIPWSFQKDVWVSMFQAYSLVLIWFLFFGSLTWMGVESLRTILFFLWLAIIINKDALLMAHPLRMNPVKE